MSQSSYWPSMVDYQEALQFPRMAFTSSELCDGTPVANQLGLPRPICGTFASVYELASGRRQWAVKCFLRNTPDLHERYAKISDHLRTCRRLRYFVTFEYLEEGILVRGKPFPLVKMEWVEGCQLNTFIAQNLSQPRALSKLKKRWIRLLADLRAAHIAHGDLQHGNVVVRPNGHLRLIDYDGMWVPTLGKAQSNETGHPDYQNPGRTRGDFHAGIDEFSGTVIEIAICALKRKPSLWEKYDNGDNLLFRRQDFLDPRSSSLISDLQALGNRAIKNKLELVIEACARSRRRPKGRAPRRNAGGRKSAAGKPSRSAESPQKPESRAPVQASWLSDYVDDYATSSAKSHGRRGK